MKKYKKKHDLIHLFHFIDCDLNTLNLTCLIWHPLKCIPDLLTLLKPYSRDHISFSHKLLFYLALLKQKYTYLMCSLSLHQLH